MEFLLTFLTNKFAIIGISICLALGVYKYQSWTIDSLKNDISAAEIVISDQSKLIDSLKENYEKIIESKNELQEETTKLKKKNTELESTLYRERQGKKKLEELARKKTELVEKAVNNGTKKALECFEIISNGGTCE